jgi:hypothetical protein
MHATKLARNLIERGGDISRDWSSVHISITDDDGAEVFSIPVSEADSAVGPAEAGTQEVSA